MTEEQYWDLRAKLDRIEFKVDNKPNYRGHFWILVLLILIALKTGAC